MGSTSPLRTQLWWDGSEYVPWYAKTRDPSMEAHYLLGSKIAFVVGAGIIPVLFRGRSCPMGGCLLLSTRAGVQLHGILRQHPLARAFSFRLVGLRESLASLVDFVFALPLFSLVSFLWGRLGWRENLTSSRVLWFSWLRSSSFTGSSRLGWAVGEDLMPRHQSDAFTPPGRWWRGWPYLRLCDHVC